jgi:hypothetical protein
MSEPQPEYPAPEADLQVLFTEDGTEMIDRLTFEKRARDIFKLPDHQDIVEKVCLDHLDDLTDPLDRGLCERTLGLVYLHEDPLQAADYFLKAEKSFLEGNSVLEAMGTLHGLAFAYSSAERWSAALTTVSRAASYFDDNRNSLKPSLEHTLDEHEDTLLQAIYERRLDALIYLYCQRELDAGTYVHRYGLLRMWLWKINCPN